MIRDVTPLGRNAIRVVAPSERGRAGAAPPGARWRARTNALKRRPGAPSRLRGGARDGCFGPQSRLTKPGLVRPFLLMSWKQKSGDEVGRKGRIQTAPRRRLPNGITRTGEFIGKFARRDWKSPRPSRLVPTRLRAGTTITARRAGRAAAPMGLATQRDRGLRQRPGDVIRNATRDVIRSATAMRRDRADRVIPMRRGRAGGGLRRRSAARGTGCGVAAAERATPPADVHHIPP